MVLYPYENGGSGKSFSYGEGGGGTKGFGVVSMSLLEV